MPSQRYALQPSPKYNQAQYNQAQYNQSQYNQARNTTKPEYNQAQNTTKPEAVCIPRQYASRGSMHISEAVCIYT